MDQNPEFRCDCAAVAVPVVIVSICSAGVTYRLDDGAERTIAHDLRRGPVPLPGQPALVILRAEQPAELKLIVARG